MSDKPKHSKLPWVAERIDGNKIGIRAENHGYVAFVENARDPQLEVDIPSVNPEWTAAQLANAEFLVKAPNCHYDLLAACKEVVKLLTTKDAGGRNHVPRFAEKTVATVRAAIAKAESETTPPEAT